MDQHDLDIARSLEADPALLPYLPFVLQDLEELGGFTHRLVSLLEGTSLGRNTNVLDLGCGKGVVACALAKEFGWNVTGVDLFEPFISDARRRAKLMKVDKLCHFVSADAREFVRKTELVDVIVMFSVDRFFGMIRDTVGEVRKALKPGGFLAIEEMVLAPGVAGPVKVYGETMDKETTLRELTAHGDRLVNVVEYDPAEVFQWNKWALERIEIRSRELLEEHPELQAALLIYQDGQREANRVLETQVIMGSYLLKRTDGE